MDIEIDSLINRISVLEIGILNLKLAVTSYHEGQADAEHSYAANEDLLKQESVRCEEED